MSATAAVWYLLAHNTPLLTGLGTVSGVAPIARIKEADALPINILFPAILVRRTDRVPRTTLAMAVSGRQHRERVQVMSHVKLSEASPGGGGKRACDALIALCLAALPNQWATINGVKVQAILPDIVSPDLSDIPTGIHAASQDFIVQWIE